MAALPDGAAGAVVGCAVWTVGVAAADEAAGADAEPLADKDGDAEEEALWDFPPPQAASPNPRTRTAGRISMRVRDTCRNRSYTIEITGSTDKLDSFLETVGRAQILETVRTGAAGIGRGERILKI